MDGVKGRGRRRAMEKRISAREAVISVGPIRREEAVFDSSTEQLLGRFFRHLGLTLLMVSTTLISVPVPWGVS